MSKIFERIIFRQISIIWNPFCQSTNVAFEKVIAHNIVFCLSLENGNVRCNEKVFRILLTDLSKAFDYLSHGLLLAKLHAYGFSISALRVICSYLAIRKQRTRINSSYSSWEEVLFGIAQGSLLGPLLFNIFLCDMFFELSLC